MNILTKTLISLKDLAYKHYKGFYTFDKKNYPKTFLSHTPDVPKTEGEFKKVIYCFWLGGEKMSNDRAKCFRDMQQKNSVPIVLVSEDNLEQYIVDGYPLHKAYPYLSAVHKSDYLRAYFMHHYGGGYSDIKSPLFDWKDSFKFIEESSNCWIVGYPETSGAGIALPEFKVNKQDYKQLYYDLRKNFRYLTGTSGFIFRPYTNFTTEWMERLHFILDQEYENLKNNPGNIRGTNSNYPFIPNNGYFALLAQIFHPLCLKYHKHIKIDKNISLSIKNYR